MVQKMQQSLPHVKYYMDNNLPTIKFSLYIDRDGDYQSLARVNYMGTKEDIQRLADLCDEDKVYCVGNGQTMARFKNSSKLATIYTADKILNQEEYEEFEI